METYDVVIVGAGPAGLQCAHALKGSEKRVLILEKNKEIGPKVCAGGLTQHDISFLNLPDKIIERGFKEVYLNTPHMRDCIASDKEIVLTIDRKKLGQWMLKRLDGSKVIVRTGAKVTHVYQTRLIVNDSEQIGFRYLVGADGSCSAVRRFLGLPAKEEDIAMHYLIKDPRRKSLEFFMDSELFHSWYAWIFPHKDYVSVGCICDPRFLPSDKLKKNFATWLKAQKIDVSKAEYQAFPINFDYKGYEFNNKFLAGDAAGLASGLTGEGIYQALRSGEAIGRMIHDRNHHSQIIEELIRTKKLHDRVLGLLEASGPVRKLEYELMGLMLKSKLIDRNILNVIS